MQSIMYMIMIIIAFIHKFEILVLGTIVIQDHFRVAYCYF